MWKEHYVNALGDKQSPINIVVNDSMQCPCGPLIWNNFYELPELMMIHNDGYSSKQKQSINQSIYVRYY